MSMAHREKLLMAKPREQYPQIYMYRRVVRAKLFIDAHYSGPMDLGMTSGEASFSKYHFIRLFKSIYGKTPHQYLIAVRVANAGLLLQQGTTVAGACYAVGFDSISSFSALFKKTVGQAPSIYQRLALERQQAMRKKPLAFIPNCFAEKKGWTQKPQFSITATE